MVYKRVKAEMDKRLKALALKKLYTRNLIKTINTKLVSVVMSVCDFSQKQIDEFNKPIKKALRDKSMHGGQAGDERLYLKVEDG